MSQEQNILDAAERIIKQESRKALTMERLEAEAQVSRATIYRRFGNKEGLLKRLATERDIPTTSIQQSDMRTRIIQAARSVCARNGILNATMEQIAVEAEVGVATVYRHFGDKDSLIRAFIEEESPHKLIRTMNMSHGADIEESLLQIVTEILIFFQENRDFLSMTFTSSTDTQDYLAQIREAPTRTLHRLATFFETEIKAGHLQGEDPLDMSTALLGMMLSFGVMVPLYYDNVPVKKPAETAQFVVRLFLDGLRGTKTDE